MWLRSWRQLGTIDSLAFPAGSPSGRGPRRSTIEFRSGFVYKTATRGQLRSPVGEERLQLGKALMTSAVRDSCSRCGHCCVGRYPGAMRKPPFIWDAIGAFLARLLLSWFREWRPSGRRPVRAGRPACSPGGKKRGP